jgi:putative photosynthetic complex assembly protein 2
MVQPLDIAVLVLGAVGLWWGATGAIFLVLARPVSTWRRSMVVATAMAVLAVAAILATRDLDTPAGALIAFASAIVLWGAVEMAFLMGFVVGGRRTPCPENLSGTARFRASFEALSHHEYLLAATLLVLGWLVSSAPNAVAFHSFALLWAMRLSTKLNIFLGVANVGEELLPPSIAYLGSYFRKAPMNPLFPLSITATTVTTLLLGQKAVAAQATPFAVTSATLLATFSALAVIEHWMLMMPMPAATLWPWAAARTAEQTLQDKRLRPQPADATANRASHPIIVSGATTRCGLDGAAGRRRPETALT